MLYYYLLRNHLTIKAGLRHRIFPPSHFRTIYELLSILPRTKHHLACVCCLKKGGENVGVWFASRTLIQKAQGLDRKNQIPTQKPARLQHATTDARRADPVLKEKTCLFFPSVLI